MLEELKQMTFASEAEEAAWWKSHEDELLEEFKKATAEGRIALARLPSARLLLPPPSASTPATSPKRASPRRRARTRYQTYLKMIVHEALRNAESARKSAKS